MRAREMILASIFLCFCLASSRSATAQLGDSWSYDELLRKADVVLIGGWRSTADTGRELRRPEITAGYPVVEMHTRFEVEAIMKDSGQHLAVGASLRLRHYRRDLERMKREQVPGAPVGLINAGSVLLFDEARHYLLFLTVGSDGLYEPLSGHTFPGDSVFRLDHARSQ